MYTLINRPTLFTLASLLTLASSSCVDNVPGPGGFTDDAPYYVEDREVGSLRLFANGQEVTDQAIISEYMDRMAEILSPFDLKGYFVDPEETYTPLANPWVTFDNGLAYINQTPLSYTVAEDLVHFMGEDTLQSQVRNIDNFSRRQQALIHTPFYCVIRTGFNIWGHPQGFAKTLNELFWVPRGNQMASPEVIMFWFERGFVYFQNTNNEWNEELGPQLTYPNDTVIIQQNYYLLTQEL